MKIYIDGKYLDEKHAKVSVFDHGLLYGDGVFEGIRAYNGRVFKLQEHIERLFYSAKAILLNLPLTHEAMAPPLSAGSLYGVTRGVAMDLGREEGLSVSEPNLTRYDLFNADECFLTGTGAEVIPVVKIDGRVIGSGQPGPVTRGLVERYK